MAHPQSSPTSDDKVAALALQAEQMTLSSRPAARGQFASQAPPDSQSVFAQYRTELESFRQPRTEHQSFGQPHIEHQGFGQPHIEHQGYHQPHTERQSYGQFHAYQQTNMSPLAAVYDQVASQAPLDSQPAFPQFPTELGNFRQPRIEHQGYRQPHAERQSYGQFQAHQQMNMFPHAAVYGQVASQVPSISQPAYSPFRTAHQGFGQPHTEHQGYRQSHTDQPMNMFPHEAVYGQIASQAPPASQLAYSPFRTEHESYGQLHTNQQMNLSFPVNSQVASQAPPHLQLASSQFLTERERHHQLYTGQQIARSIKNTGQGTVDKSSGSVTKVSTSNGDEIAEVTSGCFSQMTYVNTGIRHLHPMTHTRMRPSVPSASSSSLRIRFSLSPATMIAAQNASRQCSSWHPRTSHSSPFSVTSSTSRLTSSPSTSRRKNWPPTSKQVSSSVKRTEYTAAPVSASSQHPRSNPEHAELAAMHARPTPALDAKVSTIKIPSAQRTKNSGEPTIWLVRAAGKHATTAGTWWVCTPGATT